MLPTAVAWETPYVDTGQARAEKCQTNKQAAIRPGGLFFGSIPDHLPFTYSSFFKIEIIYLFTYGFLPMQSPYHHVCLLLILVSCKVPSCFILGSCVHPTGLLVGFLPCIYSSSYLFGLSPYRLSYICPVLMPFSIPTGKPAGCQQCC